MKWDNTMQTKLSDGLAVAGAIAGGFTSIGVWLEAIQSPLTRWTIWLVVATFFLVAAICRKTSIGSTVSVTGQPNVTPNPGRMMYGLIAMFTGGVLAADLYYVSTRGPIASSGFGTFVGSLSGFTPDSKMNPLLRDGVSNINQTKTLEDFNKSPFSGVYAESLLAKLKGNEHAIFHDFVVTVTKFEDMPEFHVTNAAAGFSDVLHASFIIKRNESPLPWKFSSKDIQFVSKGKESVGNSHFILSDDVPLTLRYFVNAEDPGIYWVKCSVLVSNGIGNPKEVVLNYEPYPLAFIDYDSNSPIPPHPPTIDEQLISVNNNISMYSNKNMAHIPEMTEEARGVMLHILEQQKKQLELKAGDQSAPVGIGSDPEPP